MHPKLKDFAAGTILTTTLMFSAIHFDASSRADERKVVTIEHEKVIQKIVIQHETVLVEKQAVIEQKIKEVNHVAKQRDQAAKDRDDAMAEIARLRASGDDQLARLREQLESVNASAKAAGGDAEKLQRIINTQGRILALCGSEFRAMGTVADGLAEEVRTLRQQWPTLGK